jgi:tight adherence protein B
MITAWPLLCFGVGLLCWPEIPSRLQPPSRFRVNAHAVPALARRWRWLLPTFVALPLIGMGGAVATVLVTVAFRQEWRSRRETARTLARAQRTSTVLRTMVAELRAGAHPIHAAEAAADAVPELSGELRNLTTAARLDGALESTVLPELATAWTLARRHGLPMADVLDAARRDVDATTTFARRLHAKMAGPRMSATVLTGLPPLCLLLGQAIGADPLRVLTRTLLGQALLIAGAALLWAGTAWSRTLTTRTAPR